MVRQRCSKAAGTWAQGLAGTTVRSKAGHLPSRPNPSASVQPARAVNEDGESVGLCKGGSGRTMGGQAQTRRTGGWGIQLERLRVVQHELMYSSAGVRIPGASCQGGGERRKGEEAAVECAVGGLRSSEFG
ncbi:unnamed protein product [Calypogeia fissa]